MGKDEKELTILLPFGLAPKYQQHNPYIRNGYRGALTAKSCVKSVFRWTNETINIWSHLLGCLLFAGLLYYDLKQWNLNLPFLDKIFLIITLVCFQITMAMSTAFHVFCCSSKQHYDDFLMYDRVGVAVALMGMYLTGFRYIFWCHQFHYWFYMSSACVLFVVTLISQFPNRLNLSCPARTAALVLWTLFGLIPVAHWSFGLMGGFDDPMVKLWLPRLIAMWILTGTAFVIYVSRIPERFYPGKVDFLGSSHQWWHLLLLGSLYHWHNTTINYAHFWSENACAAL